MSPEAAASTAAWMVGYWDGTRRSAALSERDERAVMMSNTRGMREQGFVIISCVHIYLPKKDPEVSKLFKDRTRFRIQLVAHAISCLAGECRALAGRQIVRHRSP